MFEHCKSQVVLAFRQYLFDPIELFLIDLDLVETLLVMQAVPPFGRSWCFAFLSLGVNQEILMDIFPLFFIVITTVSPSL